MQDTFMTVRLFDKFKNKGSLIWPRNDLLIWYVVAYKLISTVYHFIFNYYESEAYFLNLERPKT